MAYAGIVEQRVKRILLGLRRFLGQNRAIAYGTRRELIANGKHVDTLLP